MARDLVRDLAHDMTTARWGLARAAFGLLLVAGSALVVLSRASDRPRVAAPAPAAPQPAAWAEDVEGAPLFSAQGGPFGRAALFHRVRLQAGGPGRVEQLAFGSPHDGASFMRLSLYRASDGAAGGASFWLEMARRAGEAGFALERTPAVPDVAATRLGPAHVGHLHLRSAQGARACLGFRLEAADPPLVASGLACMDPPEAARGALVCALESVTVANPAADPAVAAFFAAARARPAECLTRTVQALPERRR